MIGSRKERELMKGWKRDRRRTALLGVLLAALTLVGCTDKKQNLQPASGQYQLTDRSYGITLKVASGSENKELEPLLERFAKENRIGLEMHYQGSIDIARSLGASQVPFDAVWPASSIWIAIGDTGHKVKYAESISTTPVVFGIRESLARKLGFVGTKVSIRDILEKIRSGELKFCMTSATQSNSGCSAYIGFLLIKLTSYSPYLPEPLRETQFRQIV